MSGPKKNNCRRKRGIRKKREKMKNERMGRTYPDNTRLMTSGCNGVEEFREGGGTTNMPMNGKAKVKKKG